MKEVDPMAIRKYTLPIPKQNIALRQVSGHTYVYYITEYYRNKKGTPTHKSVSIGKQDPNKPEFMYPNDNYFKWFEEEDKSVEKVKPSQILSAGKTIFLGMRLEQLGVTQLLKKVFPKYYQEIIQMAIFIVCQDAIMMYLKDFYEANLPLYSSTPNPNHLNKIYESLTKELRWEFFEEWQKVALGNDKEAIAYDVTSISTTSKDIDLAERGYNRDHEKLPQINVGTFYGQQTQLPICYEIYNGSIPDLSHLPTMMLIAKELCFLPKVFVMDRGYLSQDNLKYLKKENIPFIMAISESVKIYKEAFLSVAEGIRNYPNYLTKATSYGLQQPIKVDDQQYILNIYYNSEKANREEIALAQSIEAREKELAHLIGKKSRKKQDPFFRITAEKGQVLDYEKDEEGIHQAFQLVGMFGILSSEVDMNPEQVLLTYRKRDGIEKLYDNMKNSLDFYRLRVHSTQAMEGKFFIGFIAQILYADLVRILWGTEKPPVQTIKKIFIELDKIKQVTYTNQKELMTPLTKKQKDILTLFSIDLEEFKKRIIS